MRTFIRGFKDQREAGLGEEEIAARFMVSVAVVRQRLRLASVSDGVARGAKALFQ